MLSQSAWGKQRSNLKYLSVRLSTWKRAKFMESTMLRSFTDIFWHIPVLKINRHLHSNLRIGKSLAFTMETDGVLYEVRRQAKEINETRNIFHSVRHVNKTEYFGFRHCATSRKVAGSIPDGVTGIFQWLNPSGRIVALGSTQPLTEISTRNPSWG